MAQNGDIMAQWRRHGPGEKRLHHHAGQLREGPRHHLHKDPEVSAWL